MEANAWKLTMNKLSCLVAMLLCPCVMAAEVIVAEYETTPAVWIDADQGRLMYSDGIARLDCSRQRAYIFDTIVPYFECKVYEGWFSVTSPMVVFSYDLSWNQLPLHWERDGYLYSVVSSRIDSEFGTLKRIAVYSKSRPEEFFIVDFSTERGIAQFLHLDSEAKASQWFRLTTSVGLGVNDKLSKENLGKRGKTGSE